VQAERSEQCYTQFRDHNNFLIPSFLSARAVPEHHQKALLFEMR
jgi:hypothetical protein